MAKRTRSEVEFGPNVNLSTLGVFTYQGTLSTHYVPSKKEDAALPAVLAAVFGSRRRHSTFSMTSSAEGDFLVLDESLHRELFGGAGAQVWSCLYIHEGSSERTGAEISGALSMLCDRLARARVPVLNVCTLSRNFMLVRQDAAERALTTLRSAVEEGCVRPGTTAHGGSGEAVKASKGGCGGGNSGDSSMSGVRIELKRAEVCIGTLSVEDIKAASHALLSLFFLRRARPAFTHYFEMGGEVSLILDTASLDALKLSEPTSIGTLLSALEPTLSTGWRVLSVTAPAGSDGIGILCAVCLPLAGLPLLNVRRGVSRTRVLACLSAGCCPLSPPKCDDALKNTFVNPWKGSHHA